MPQICFVQECKDGCCQLSNSPLYAVCLIDKHVSAVDIMHLSIMCNELFCQPCHFDDAESLRGECGWTVQDQWH